MQRYRRTDLFIRYPSPLSAPFTRETVSRLVRQPWIGPASLGRAFLRSASATTTLRSWEERLGRVAATIWIPRYREVFSPTGIAPVTSVTGSSRLFGVFCRGRALLRPNDTWGRAHGSRNYHRRADGSGVACRNHHAHTHIDRGVHRDSPDLGLSWQCVRATLTLIRGRLAEPEKQPNDHSSRTGG